MLTGVAARVKWLASEWQLLAQSGRRQARNLKVMGSTFSATKRLSKTDLFRGHAGQDQLNSRSLAGFGIKTEPAAQAIRDDGVDDVEAQTSTALIPAGREERIEGFAPDIKAHTAAVIRKNNFDIIMAGGLDLDVDEAFKAVGKRMRDRIEEEVGLPHSGGTM